MNEFNMPEPRHYTDTVKGVKISALFMGLNATGGAYELAYLRREGDWEDWDAVARVPMGEQCGAYCAFRKYIQEGGDPAEVADVQWTGNAHKIVTFDEMWDEAEEGPEDGLDYSDLRMMGRV